MTHRGYHTGGDNGLVSIEIKPFAALWAPLRLTPNPDHSQVAVSAVSVLRGNPSWARVALLTLVAVHVGAAVVHALVFWGKILCGTLFLAK